VPITIPLEDGQSATILLKRELTPRRQLPYKALLTQYQELTVKIAQARTVTLPDGRAETDESLAGPDVTLTFEQAEFLNMLDYALIPAYVVEWSLPLPLPTTVDKALDLPIGVADALLTAIRRVANGLEVWQEYEPSPATLEDLDSPSGRSGSTKTGSGASGRGRKSPARSKTS
jgi:hypothetical protein